MKNTNYRQSFNHSLTNAVALTLAAMLVLVSVPHKQTSAQQRGATKTASENASNDQRIVHILNRLGFGARPGDVERVRAIGVERYIEQQLNPDKIDDSTLEAKLKNLPSLALDTPALLAKYPNTGLLLRRLQRDGKLPADLATLRENRRDPGMMANGQMQNERTNASEAANDQNAQMNGQSTTQNTETRNNVQDNGARREYRRAVQEFYRERNLLQPRLITQELQQAKLLRAVYSERQLEAVMGDFWLNHFNVYAPKGAVQWMLAAYEREAIRPNALGNFRDLLRATAQSPAMLFYLDNYQSVAPNTQGGLAGNRRMQNGGMNAPLGNRRQNMRRRESLFGGNDQMRGRGNDTATSAQDRPAMQDGNNEAMTQQPTRPRQPRRTRGINENYARELMELHTLGVDGGYTQKDIVEVARCFTGWTIYDPRGAMAIVADNARLSETSGKFYFNARLHDAGEKTVLGQKIPAGGGMEDGLKVLEILARHPSTAKFIATKLARRFVTDNPSPELISRIAAAYTKSDGDIKETLRHIFSSTEFNQAASRRQKIKTPFELVASSIRALGGETNGGVALNQWLGKLGEPLYMYQAPTGYPDNAETWVNTGALLERMNFALALAANRIPGTRVNLSKYAAKDAGREAVVDQFTKLLLHSDVSVQTQARLLKQLNEPAATPVSTLPAGAEDENDDEMMTMNNAGGGRRGQRGQRRMEIPGDTSETARIAGLILGSPEFQRQ